MRVAAIDIGTNSVLLSIASRRGDGTLQIELDRCTITRLGQGVDKTRRLDPAAVERTLRCLSEYAELLATRDIDRLEVVGTSALRDAASHRDFLDRAKTLLGVEPRVIAGVDEATLSFRGALSDLTVSGRVLVVDIGGGSTEVIVGEVTPEGPRADEHTSLDLGCVRLTERYVSSDPPRSAALAQIRESTQAGLNSLGFAVYSDPSTPTALSENRESTHLGSSSLGTAAHCGALVAVAGTATTLAAIDLGLREYDGARVHGHTLSRQRLESLVRQLAALPHAERTALPGMEPRRADVIVAGGVMLATVLEVFDRDEVVVSDRGVRFGLLESMLEELARQKR